MAKQSDYDKKGGNPLKGKFSEDLKKSKDAMKSANDLDNFLILVFENPEEKRAYCKKYLGDPHIDYIEGKYYEIK